MIHDTTDYNRLLAIVDAGFHPDLSYVPGEKKDDKVKYVPCAEAFRRLMYDMALAYEAELEINRLSAETNAEIDFYVSDAFCASMDDEQRAAYFRAKSILLRESSRPATADDFQCHTDNADEFRSKLKARMKENDAHDKLLDALSSGQRADTVGNYRLKRDNVWQRLHDDIQNGKNIDEIVADMKDMISTEDLIRCGVVHYALDITRDLVNMGLFRDKELLEAMRVKDDKAVYDRVLANLRDSGAFDYGRTIDDLIDVIKKANDEGYFDDEDDEDDDDE